MRPARDAARVGGWAGPAVVAATVVGAALRLTWLRLAHLPDSDGALFAAFARELAAGRIDGTGFFVSPVNVFTQRPPLYPLLAAFVTRLCGDPFVAGVLVSAVAGVATVVLVACLARSLFDDRVAVIAAWATAVHPGLIDLSGQILRESVAAALFTGAAVGVVAAVVRRRASPAFVAGAILGVAAMNRLDTLLVGFPALGLVAWLGSRGGPTKAPGVLRRTVGWAVIGVASTLVPSMSLMYAGTGSPITASYGARVFHLFERAALVQRAPSEVPAISTPERGSTDEAVIVAPPPAGPTLEAVAVRATAWSHVATAARSWSLSAYHIVRYSALDLLPPLYLVFVGVGLFAARGALEGTAFTLPFLFALATHAFFYVETRYVLPYATLLLPFVAAGVVEASTILSRRLAERGRAMSSRGCAVGLTCLLALGGAHELSWPLRKPLTPEHAFIAEHDAARFIAATAPPGSIVMSRHPLIASLSGMRWLFTPREGCNRVVEAARYYPGSYLVIDRLSSLANPATGLEALIDEAPRDGLIPLWRRSYGSEQDIVVFVVEAPVAP